MYQKKTAHETKTTKRSIQGRDLQKRKTINQYSFEEDLGRGSYAKVKLGVCGEKKEKYAIKIFDKESLKKVKNVVEGKDGEKAFHDLFENVMQEIEIMRTLDHPNIIRMHEIIDDEEDQNLFIVLDYAARGELLSFAEEKGKFYNKYEGKSESIEDIEKTTGSSDSVNEFEAQIRKKMRDLINGLEYIHSKGIIHRDLKPENILVDENGTVKIADFGVALKLPDINDDIIKGQAGTYYFMSPECCKKKGENYSGKAADIWSLGVILYVLITMKLPFTGEGSGQKQLMDLFDKINEGKYEEPKKISSNLSDLLKKLLAVEAKDRIQMEAIKKHPFLTNLNT